MFISGAVGFLFFALLPLAPPRLVGLGLVDTVTEQSNAYRALQPPGLTNQYAAFPSLHAGWNLLVGAVLLVAGVPLLVRLFALVSPVAMAFAVVATANHYVLDVAAGYAVVLGALAVALRIEATLDARDRHGAPRRGRSAEPPSRRPPRREPARAAARLRPARSAARRG
jgi:membrane-associated phospholipid phosphatase